MTLSKINKRVRRYKLCVFIYHVGRTCSATLVRMIGVTAASTNVRMLLRSLCLQLCHVFDKNPADVPNVSNGHFTKLLNPSLEHCCRLYCFIFYF